MRMLILIVSVISTLAIVGVGVVWNNLFEVSTKLDHLNQIHEHSASREMVELKGEQAIQLLDLKQADLNLQNLVILGSRTEFIPIGNQNHGRNQASKEITIEIPEGTTQVIPILRGFISAFGELTALPNGSFEFRIVDHHFGLQYVDVAVTEVGQRTAKILALMWLRDINGDDKWSGVVVTNLLFLGPQS